MKRAATRLPLQSGMMLPALLVFAAAVAVRLGRLADPPQNDELYHILSALSWIETGEFRIADGTYDRSWLYTVLIASIFEIFGESLTAARASSVFLGSLHVAVAFAWTHVLAGRAAALIMAFLAILWPTGILVSTVARFYPLHGLLFMLFSIGAYWLCGGGRCIRGKLLVGLGTGVCFALALHLQITTLVGFLAVSVWFGLSILLPLVLQHPKRWWILLSLVSFAFFAAAIAMHTGFFASAWETFRVFAPHSPQPGRDDLFFYHEKLLHHYTYIWALFPVALLVGVGVQPRLTLFCAVLFGVCLIVHSFAAMKNLRYMYYAIPYFFIIIGIAGANVGSSIVRFLDQMSHVALRRVAPSFATTTYARASVCAVAIFFFGATYAFPYALALAIGKGEQHYFDWSSARPSLEDRFERQTLVATTDELRTLYYFGRYDVAVGWPHLSEISGEDFNIDPRTGKLAVSEGAALARLIECSPEGLFLTSKRGWQNRASAPFRDAMISLPHVTFQEVAVPQAAGLVAVSWESASVEAANCQRVPTQ